jgi:hypothetical protein
MSAMFDFRAIRDVISYPARLIFGDGSTAFETRDCSDRPSLVMRWWRGKDGRLESRWERSE